MCGQWYILIVVGSTTVQREKKMINLWPLIIILPIILVISMTWACIVWRMYLQYEERERVIWLRRYPLSGLRIIHEDSSSGENVSSLSSILTENGRAAERSSIPSTLSPSMSTTMPTTYSHHPCHHCSHVQKPSTASTTYTKDIVPTDDYNKEQTPSLHVPTTNQRCTTKDCNKMKSTELPPITDNMIRFHHDHTMCRTTIDGIAACHTIDIISPSIDKDAAQV